MQEENLYDNTFAPLSNDFGAADRVVMDSDNVLFFLFYKFHL